MALLRSTVCFAAGVAVGAFGRDALPALREKLPLLKEQLEPVLVAAVSGARAAATDACGHVARQVSEFVGASHDTVAPTRPPGSGSSATAA